MTCNRGTWMVLEVTRRGTRRGATSAPLPRHGALRSGKKRHALSRGHVEVAIVSCAAPLLNHSLTDLGAAAVAAC